MTKEEILKMEAGKEIDLEVARLFKLNWINSELNYDGSMGDVFVLQNDGVWKFTPEVAYKWEPSKDIAAAWEVLGRFDRVSWDIDVNSLTDDDGKFWGCALDEYFEESDGRHTWAAAETAPLAICRAALLTTL